MKVLLVYPEFPDTYWSFQMGAPAPSRAEPGELCFQMETYLFERSAREGAGAPT